MQKQRYIKTVGGFVRGSRGQHYCDRPRTHLELPRRVRKALEREWYAEKQAAKRAELQARLREGVTE